jgi:tight adherence protein B
MVQYIAILVFAAVFLSTLAAYLSLRGRVSPQSRQVRKRMGDLSTQAKEDDRFVFSILRDNRLSKIPLLHRLLAKTKLSRSLQKMIEQSGAGVNAGTFVLAMASLAGLLFLITNVVTGNIVFALVAAVLGASLPYILLASKRTKRIDRFESTLPEAIDMIVDALRSGFSFESALRLVSQEMPDPLGTEFAITFEEQNLGVSFSDVLYNLQQRVPSDDLNLFATALMIHRRTGGNLAEVLSQTGATIRERYAFKGEVKSKTIHSRFSGAILVVLPVVVIGVILLLNPGYFMILIEDKTGNYLLGGAFILQLLGIWVIRRIVDIRI